MTHSAKTTLFNNGVPFKIDSLVYVAIEHRENSKDKIFFKMNELTGDEEILALQKKVNSVDRYKYRVTFVCCVGVSSFYAQYYGDEDGWIKYEHGEDSYEGGFGHMKLEVKKEGKRLVPFAVISPMR